MSDSQISNLIKRMDRQERILRLLAHETSVFATNVVKNADKETQINAANRISNIAQELTNGLGGADQT